GEARVAAGKSSRKKYEYNIASMLLLALETVTRAGSLALCDGDGSCASGQGDARLTHGVRLPGELLRFLATQDRSLGDVDAFVVVTGPGSFTGLRVGLAPASGLGAGHKPTGPRPA